MPAVLLTGLCCACTKGTPETRPSIEIKEINATEFVSGGGIPIGDLRITLEFQDKEGDLGGGIVTYVRQRTNIKPITDAASNDKVDTIRNTIPEFPKSTIGDIQLLVPGTFLSEDPFENDTMVFKIFVQDLAGNISDTVTTPSIVERMQ